MNTTAIYKPNKLLLGINTTAITSELGNPEIRATILLAVVAFHGPLLLGLSSRQRRSSNPVLRSLLWGVSAAYFPLMTYVLSYLTTYIPSAGDQVTGVLVLVILVQFLRAKADMAALAVAAVALPAAGDNDVNSLKIRPSTESFINTFWVAGLVTYNVYKTLTVTVGKKTPPSSSSLSPPSTPSSTGTDDDLGAGVLWIVVALMALPLWALGACRTVLRFVAFQRATGSFALGRNVQLIDGYMLQLREEGDRFIETEMVAAQSQQLPVVRVPRLIVTGERNQDVVDSPLGYHVKRSSLRRGEGRNSRLVTLDRVWDSRRLRPEDKDLCLSFALFKCLRRRFASYRFTAEAGSSWAFGFVCDGLLGPPEDHERIFKVVATELSFARDFFHKPLPVASLGTMAAALHFLLSLIIFPLLFLMALVLLLVYLILVVTLEHYWYPLELLALVLTLVNASTEISEMVTSVRSNWTKISIIGHLIRSRLSCSRGFLACLLKCCKAPKFWDDEIRQTQMLKPDLFIVRQPCACSRRFFRSRQLLSLGRCRRNHHDHYLKDPIKVPLEVKKTILETLRCGGGQLSDGTAAIRRHGHGFARDNDITWACREGGGVVTATDTILVWHIATTLFDMKCRFDSSPASPPPPPPPSTTPVANDDSMSNKVVDACSLSRYCAYLVAEAPDLLPDNPAWITRRYKAVKKRIEEAPKSNGDESSVYQHLLDTFGENSHSHPVLIKGVKLGKQLVEEAEIRRQRSQGEAGAKAEDEVWKLLSEFWSEMVLYLAPSDNVNVHIEALQRGGELITLLWALLLHAGITSRPGEFNFTASVLLSTEDADAIAVENC